MDRPSRPATTHHNAMPGPIAERFVAHIIDALILFLPLFVLWAVGLRNLPFAFASVPPTL